MQIIKSMLPIVLKLDMFFNMYLEGESSQMTKDNKVVCRYHDDSSPSFRIHKNGMIGNCFVCGAGGSILTLIRRAVVKGKVKREYSHLTYEALLLLICSEHLKGDFPYRDLKDEISEDVSALEMVDSILERTIVKRPTRANSINNVHTLFEKIRRDYSSGRLTDEELLVKFKYIQTEMGPGGDKSNVDAMMMSAYTSTKDIKPRSVLELIGGVDGEDEDF